MVTNYIEDKNKKTNILFKIALLMLFGVLLGVLAFCFFNKEVILNLANIEDDFLNIRLSENYLSILFSSLLNSSVIIVLLFLLGFYPFAQPLEIIIPIYKGLGYGVTVAQLYYTNGAKGILMSLILILPNALISSYAVFIGVRESLTLSNGLFSHMFLYRKFDNIKETIKLYSVKFLVLEAIISLSSAIDCICCLLYNTL